MTIRELAKTQGFAEAYLLPPAKYEEWVRRRNDGAFHPNTNYIKADIAEAYPYANAVLILLWTYVPYTETWVSGYYVASNDSYKAMQGVLALLKERGIRAEKADLPMRELLCNYGIGTVLKSGLMSIQPFGTRFCLQAIALELDEPEYSEAKPETALCLDCGRCEKACPGGAISKSGQSYQRCVRAYMGGEPMPDWAEKGMHSLLGCEICQRVCPLNSHIGTKPMESEVREAFDLERLANGDIEAAQRFVGKNTKWKRLVPQARILLERKKQP